MRARKIRLDKLDKLKNDLEERLARDEKKLQHEVNFILKVSGMVGDMAREIIEDREVIEKLVKELRRERSEIKTLKSHVKKLDSRVMGLENRHRNDDDIRKEDT